ncbi:hypothetical protein EBU02_04575 [bacterium]|nr:hypothetical protein [bacterium]
MVPHFSHFPQGRSRVRISSCQTTSILQIERLVHKRS